jgi:hypothetical protein
MVAMEPVARMERSAIRESLIAAPDFASLHPGYAYFAPRNDVKYDFAFPRRDAPEVCMNLSPRKTEGVGNAGCPRTRSLACKCETKHTSVVTARFAEITRHSRTQWF